MRSQQATATNPKFSQQGSHQTAVFWQRVSTFNVCCFLPVAIFFLSRERRRSCKVLVRTIEDEAATLSSEHHDRLSTARFRRDLSCRLDVHQVHLPGRQNISLWRQEEVCDGVGGGQVWGALHSFSATQMGPLDPRTVGAELVGLLSSMPASRPWVGANRCASKMCSGWHAYVRTAFWLKQLQP